MLPGPLWLRPAIIFQFWSGPRPQIQAMKVRFAGLGRNRFRGIGACCGFCVRNMSGVDFANWRTCLTIGTFSIWWQEGLITDQFVPKLRQRFLQDMRIKGLQPKTQMMYLRAMRDLTRHLGRAQSGGRNGTRAAIPGGLQHGLWRSAACRRSDPPEGRRHRQRPDVGPHRSGQGSQGRHVILSPSLLELLRDDYRKARPAGWLSPGRNRVDPISTRQFNRAFGVACDFAEIKKGHVAYTAAQLCDASAGG